MQNPAIINFAKLVLRSRFQVKRNTLANQSDALMDGF